MFELKAWSHARIWYQSFVHPVDQAPYIERLQAMRAKVAASGTTFEVHGLDPPDHSFPALTECRCAAQVIGSALAGEKAGYDAFVIGHFQEPKSVAPSTSRSSARVRPISWLRLWPVVWAW